MLRAEEPRLEGMKNIGVDKLQKLFPSFFQRTGWDVRSIIKAAHIEEARDFLFPTPI
jgi:hypothetical protein